MVLPMIAIGLAQRLIAPHPSNAVFDHNPPPRKRAVVGDVLDWAIFPSRFAAWRGAQALRVQFVDPHVGQIANPTHTLWQAIEQTRFLQDFDVAFRPRHTLRDIDNPATL